MWLLNMYDIFSLKKSRMLESESADCRCTWPTCLCTITGRRRSSHAVLALAFFRLRVESPFAESACWFGQPACAALIWDPLGRHPLACPPGALVSRQASSRFSCPWAKCDSLTLRGKGERNGQGVAGWAAASARGGDGRAEREAGRAGADDNVCAAACGGSEDGGAAGADGGSVRLPSGRLSGLGFRCRGDAITGGSKADSGRRGGAQGGERGAEGASCVVGGAGEAEEPGGGRENCGLEGIRKRFHSRHTLVDRGAWGAEGAETGKPHECGGKRG